MALKGWKPKTESDETEFGRMLVNSLEDAEDLMGDISVEDITKNLPRAARAVEFESIGGGNKLVIRRKSILRRRRIKSKSWRRTEDGQNRVGQTKKKVQSQKNLARDAEGEQQTSWLSSTFL